MSIINLADARAAINAKDREGVLEGIELFEKMLRGALEDCCEDLDGLDPTGFLSEGFIARCAAIGQAVRKGE